MDPGRPSNKDILWPLPLTVSLQQKFLIQCCCVRGEMKSSHKALQDLEGTVYREAVTPMVEAAPSRWGSVAITCSPGVMEMPLVNAQLPCGVAEAHLAWAKCPGTPSAGRRATPSELTDPYFFQLSHGS